MANGSSPVDKLDIDSLDVLQSYAIELEHQVYLRTTQLQKQITQEQALARILQRIRQSLDQSAILQSAVDEVRLLLKADRVLIYQFQPDWSGLVVTESVGAGWTPSLGRHIQDTCFQSGGGQRYHQGRKVAIANIDDANLSDCHRDLLGQFEVRATLVVPILWADQLWGLLIAHQCSGPRIWQADELALLDRLSVQLAIAIRQAELYQQAQADICDRNLAQVALQDSEQKLRQAVETLQCQNQLLEAISEVQNQAIAQVDLRILFETLLHELLSLTESGCGFTGEVLYTDLGAPYMDSAYFKISGQPDLAIHTISEVGWYDPSRAFYAENLVKDSESHNLKTLFGAVIATGQPVIVNSSNRHFQREGFPTAYPPIYSFLGIPFFSHGKITSIVGIANKPKGYPVDLVDYLQPFLTTYSQIIESYWNLRQQKQAEQKILEQAALLNVTTDAILVRDLEGQIVFWNRGAERLYGWSESEALGQFADQLLYADGCTLSPEIQPYLTTDGHWQGELTQRIKSGQEIIVESRWALVHDPQGKITATLTVNTDITEQKQLEEQFLRAQRLESIGTLASGIAHDLNNILTPIIGIAQLLPLKLPETDSYTQNLLDILQDNARRGAEIVKQVLTFARGEDGDRTVLMPKTVIEEIYRLLISTFPKRIEIELDLAPDLSKIEGDTTQLHQVFMNLCVNARDAMPDGGKLTIQGTNYQVDQAYAKTHLEAHPGDYVVVRISDTGVGMSATVKQRIFEPFYTTKTPGKGTGLGLSTVLGIIRKHGGFIQVSSKVSYGTTFQVYLPAVEGG